MAEKLKQYFKEFLSLRLALVFFAVLLIGITARLFSFAFLPESAYADSLFHLKIIYQAVETGIIATPDILTLPLYYYISSVFFAITALPFKMPFLRIIPFVIFLLQLILSFAVLSKLCKSKLAVLAGTSFIAVFPWLVRYGPVNYIGQFASVLILLFYYLILRFSREGNQRKSYLMLAFTGLALAGIAVSKINAAILFPILLASLLLVQNSTRKYSKKIIALTAIAIIALSAAWFIAVLLVQPQAVNSAKVAMGRGIPFDFMLPQNLFKSFLSFFDFPPTTAFQSIPFLSQIPWLSAAVIFALIVLPLFYCILKGLKQHLFSRKPITVSIALSILALTALAFYNSRTSGGIAYIRYLIPVMPLIGIAFAVGFEKIKQGSSVLKKIIIVSLIIFAFYSLALSSTSALFYQSVFEKEQPLYAELSKLPASSKIASFNKDRQVWFYTGLQSETPSIGQTSSLEEFHAALRQDNFTHVAVTCYKDDWNLKLLEQLEAEGKIEKTFQQDCAMLFEIK